MGARGLALVYRSHLDYRVSGLRRALGGDAVNRCIEACRSAIQAADTPARAHPNPLTRTEQLVCARYIAPSS
jgi:hypothetical protein